MLENNKKEMCLIVGITVNYSFTKNTMINKFALVLNEFTANAGNFLG